MKKVMHIVANPKEKSKSYSRQAGDYITNKLNENGNIEIIEFDVYKEDIQILDQIILSAMEKRTKGMDFKDLSDQEQAKMGRIFKIIDQFADADEYIFSYPMWNFGIPAMLKAYVDNLIVAGKTFNYTPQGPVGLLKDKKALIVQASGGIYSLGEAKKYDHGSYYLEQMMNFIGVTEVEHVKIEGVAVFADLDNDRLKETFEQLDAAIDFLK